MDWIDAFVFICYNSVMKEKEVTELSGTIMIGIILIMRVVQSVCSKQASNDLPLSWTGRFSYFGFSHLCSALCALPVFLVDGAHVTASAVILGIGSGICIVIASVCSQLALQSGTMALSSMFSAAGLLIPCVTGIFWFDQPMSLWQWLAVIVLLGATYLLVISSRTVYARFSLKTIWLLLGSFLANGATMLLQTVYSLHSGGENVAGFSFFTFAVPAVLLIGMAHCTGTGEQRQLPKRLYGLGICLAVALFVINQLATQAAAVVPGAVLFTLISGSTTVISALVGAFLYREKLGISGIIGLVIGVAALVIIKAC